MWGAEVFGEDFFSLSLSPPPLPPPPGFNPPSWTALLPAAQPTRPLRFGPPYLSVSPLPGLQYGRRLLLAPVDVGNLVVAPKVLKHLLGSHQLEHGLQGLGTEKGSGEGRRGEGGRRRGGRKEEGRNMSRRRGFWSCKDDFIWWLINISARQTHIFLPYRFSEPPLPRGPKTERGPI